MNERELRALLADVAEGRVTPDAAELQIRQEPYVDLGYAKPDLQRGIRTGAAEVIYGAGKTAGQIAGIVQAMVEAGQKTVLITRLDAEKAQGVAGALPDDVGAEFAYRETERCGLVGHLPEPTGNGMVVVAAAGTSDLPVAEEAALTAEVMASRVTRLYDVGVAGLHRLLDHTDDIMEATAIVAVAGMEGALASVIGGMAACPVIAVPTSVGYGASFHGLSALLSMLNSCASGVSVVNIDNGFGAGYQAALIDHARVRG
jgi:NCAIR mutase (PurE)-related protein